MGNCGKCGYDHQRLGIRIDAGTLHRSADKQRHMLTRVAGGAWSFDAHLLKAHREIDFFIITDRNTAETWQTDRRTFDANAFDFGGDGKAQKALALRYWGDGERHDHEAERAPAGVQLILTGASELQGTRFEPARKPRPRLEPKHRRWG